MKISCFSSFININHLGIAVVLPGCTLGCGTLATACSRGYSSLSTCRSGNVALATCRGGNVVLNTLDRGLRVTEDKYPHMIAYKCLYITETVSQDFWSWVFDLTKAKKLLVIYILPNLWGQPNAFFASHLKSTLTFSSLHILQWHFPILSFLKNLP